MVAATPHLTAQELVSALEALDIEQIELARLLDVGVASAQRWVSGKVGVPGYVSMFVRLLIARPELKEVVGAQPRSGRGRPPKPRGKRPPARKAKAA